MIKALDNRLYMKFMQLEIGLLGRRIATLVCENKGKTSKLKSLKPSDFELVKTTANDKYKNVYTRIYTSSSGKASCRISE